MNKKQKTVLIAIAVVILGMLLYPPFHWRVAGGQVGSAGYSWIFDPPPSWKEEKGDVDENYES